MNEETEAEVYMTAQEELGRSSAFMLFSLDQEGRMGTLGYTPRPTEAVGFIDMIYDYVLKVYDRIHKPDEEEEEEEENDVE